MRRKKYEEGFEIFNDFMEERDKVFQKFVVDEQLFDVIQFANKWGIKYPNNERLFKISICIAIQRCNDLDYSVKRRAYDIASQLGYKGDDIRPTRKKKNDENCSARM